MSNKKKVLLITHKTISTSPRIMKQILWLQELGWEVDTIGLDETAPKFISGEHRRIASSGKFKRYFAYVVFSGRRRYEFLFGKKYPLTQIADLSGYKLLVIHDLTHLANKKITNVFMCDDAPKVILDLHENFLSPVSRSVFEKLAFDRYQSWEVTQLKHFAVLAGKSLSVSAASSGLVEIYSAFLEVDVALMRNSNTNHDMMPSSVDERAIELVHHGVATKSRGLESYIFALRKLPKNFKLNLMLIGDGFYLAKLKMLVRVLNLSERVTFVKPVAAENISKALNIFDIALIILPPVNENQANTLPGKFFDSVQARLMVLTGPNPELAGLVQSQRIGKVLKNWKVKEIVRTLLSLSATDITGMKYAAHRVAADFSSAAEKRTFNKLLGKLFNDD